MPLFSRAFEKSERLFVQLSILHLCPEEMVVTEIVLGVRITLFSGFPAPPHGLLMNASTYSPLPYMTRDCIAPLDDLFRPPS